jgi:hypothetical protein
MVRPVAFSGLLTILPTAYNTIVGALWRVSVGVVELPPTGALSGRTEDSIRVLGKRLATLNLRRPMSMQSQIAFRLGRIELPKVVSYGTWHDVNVGCHSLHLSSLFHNTNEDKPFLSLALVVPRAILAEKTLLDIHLHLATWHVKCDGDLHAGLVYHLDGAVGRGPRGSKR